MPTCGAPLESAWFGISDTPPWLLWAVLILGTTALAMVLATLLVWSVSNRKRHSIMLAHERWEPLVLEYLCNSGSEDRAAMGRRIGAEIHAHQRVLFGDFILGYLKELRGAEADNLRKLLATNGFSETGRRGLRARDSWVRARAALLLGGLRDVEAIPALITATHDHNEVTSYAAATALIQIGGRESLAAVTSALGRRDDWNPSQIKEILLEGGTEFGEDLAELLARCNPAEEKTKILVELLGNLRYYSAGTLMLEFLRSNPSEELRISLIRSLGRLEFDGASTDLLQALEDPNWVVRSQATLALGRIGGEHLIPRFENALHDESYWVRFNAAVALDALGLAGRPVLERVARSASPASLIAQEILLVGGSP